MKINRKLDSHDFVDVGALLKRLMGPKPTLTVIDSTGETHRGVTLLDPDEFLMAHCHGPNTLAKRPTITSEIAGVTSVRQISPETTWLSQVDQNGMVRFLVFGVAVQHEKDIPAIFHAIKAPLFPFIQQLQGSRRYAVFLLFDKAKKLCDDVFFCQRQAAGTIACSPGVVRMCAKALVPHEAVLLPCSWKRLSAGRISDLQILSTEEELMTLSMPSEGVPWQLSSTGTTEAEMSLETVSRVTDYWFKQHGEAYVRAGALLKSLPESVQKLYPANHAGSVFLGTMLRKLAGKQIGNCYIEAQKRGRSFRFRLRAGTTEDHLQ